MTPLRLLNKTAAALLILGLLQMTGDFLRLTTLKGIGAATGASPAPRVFSTVRGLETYSTRLYLEWTTHDGVEQSLLLTPEIYARVQGPYNRRNIYGAVLAYGPVLLADPRTKRMFDAVAAYAVCGRAPLLRELGIDPAGVAGPMRVRVEPLPGTDMGGLPRVLEVPCS